MLDDILSQVMKPGRYIGQEWNLPKKDFDRADIKFALCFPDLYEVGMSNLGLRILYGILNNIHDVVCERFFAPHIDLENKLRGSKTEIFSLESRKNLSEFDMIGFSLGYELLFTNVLNILDLGVIPLKSASRTNNFPLVIGGGPCTLNPEPMHEFFDLFIIGEAEEAIIELLDSYRKVKDDFKTSRLNKKDLLIMLSKIEGVYAPSLYKERYDAEGVLVEFKPEAAGLPVKIKKRVVKNLDSAYFPIEWIIPFIQVVHDRVTLEIMRGCPNSCRFCQARQQYFPFRQKSVDNIFNTALKIYNLTGYEEIALGGLSVSDYTHIEDLLKMLTKAFKEKCVGISLPSIKPKNVIGNLSSLIASIKKTGLTFAPESGTERMRNILAKDFDLKVFLKAMEEAFLAGYQHLKLYFMIGLPFEEETDLDGIVEFAVGVSELRRKVTGHCAKVNLSINTLIPKPHTPFQWFKMQDLDTIKYKQDYLKKKISRHKNIRVHFHDRYVSFLEGVFSRGDRRLSRVIFNAFNSGARFDAWDEHFDFGKWSRAFDGSNIDPVFYLREIAGEELLPWDLLDTGVSKESLRLEFNKVIDIK